MAHLNLKTLQCVRTEDSTGADEPYLRVDGNKVWSTDSLNDDQSVRIDKSVTFSGTSFVALYDEDAGGPDNDDQLGAFTALAKNADGRNRAHTFTNNDEDYTYILFYTITP